MPGIQVRLLRLQYQRGSRMLVPAGGAAQTDDRGAYRIWGLNPGEYFVSATAPNFRGPGGRGAAVGGGRGRGAGADDGVDIGYAPTYFPGVPSVFEATPVAVGLSGEMLDVNFNLLLVRTAQITGRITNADGTPVTAGAVNLRPDAPGGIGAPSVTLGGRINWDGAFSIANVPPGRYVLTARGRDDVAPQYGWLPITVGGEDLAGVVLVLAPGATMSGIVSAQAVRSTTPPDLTQVRVTVQPADAGVFGGAPASRVQKDGTFTMSGIPTGPFLVRAQAPRGWTVKSIIVDGREVVDSPIDVRAGQKLAGASIVLSDRQTEINGVVADRQRTPVTDYTVLAFPADSALWTPWSRHIATVRPDQNGRYQFTTLPPGDYLMALIDPEQPGEWFDPRFLEAQRADAGRVTLADGDVKTHDFSIAP
jgi:hypothetical protein